jgi:hypothetical protein
VARLSEPTGVRKGLKAFYPPQNPNNFGQFPVLNTDFIDILALREKREKRDNYRAD